MLVLRVNNLRKLAQFSAIGLMVLIPVLESYKRLLNYMNPEDVGSLWHFFKDFLTYTPAPLKGGYFSWLVVGLDSLLGNLLHDTETLQAFLSNFAGSYWSVTIGGITFIDPLAVAQILGGFENFSLGFVIAAFLPILLALVLGRIFCSWFCPFNTVLEFLRLLCKKLRLRPPNYRVITVNLGFLVILAGIVFALMGKVIFPYILPYALMGRFFYYLSTGIIFWTGLYIFLVILAVDLFVQKGVWCNYLCPSGTLLSLLGRRRFLRLKRNESLCRESCSLCKNICSWEFNPKAGDVLGCTNCAVCIEKCPSKALTYNRPD